MLGRRRYAILLYGGRGGVVAHLVGGSVYSDACMALSTFFSLGIVVLVF